MIFSTSAVRRREPLSKAVRAKLEGPDSSKWWSATHKEAKNFNDKTVFDPGEKSTGYTYSEVKAMGGQMMDLILLLNEKRNGSCKARLVADGRQLRPELEVHTKASSASANSVMAFLAAAAARGHRLVSSDIRSAYLVAPTREDELVFVRVPEGIGLEHEGKICRVRRAVYGMASSGKSWQREMERRMLAGGFKQCVKDRNVYKRTITTATGTKETVYCCVYVDDVLASGASEEVCWQALQTVLGEVEHTRNEGDLLDFLGLDICQVRGVGIQVNVASKILALADEHNLLNAEPMPELSWNVIPGDEASPKEGSAEEKLMLGLPYLSLVMSLAWLADHVRRDVLWAVNRLKQYSQRPGPAHYEMAQRVLVHLKSTAYRGLFFKSGASLQMECYTDATWLGSTKGKSTSGIVLMCAGACIAAASQKQSVVAASTFESELIAAAGGAKMVIGARDILRFLDAPQETTIMHIDNAATVAFGNVPVYNGKTRHLAARYYYLDQLIEQGVLEIRWISTTRNIADVQTKGLPRGVHRQHTVAMGMADLAVKKPKE